MDTPLRIVFLGTAAFAGPSLEALAGSPGFSIVGVVTQPDRPSGRGLAVHPPPVKTLAARLGLPVLQPDRLRDPPALERVAGLRPDLIVVAAYGQILPRAALDLPRFGALNVHASLLPRHRGAAPIQWALLNGDPVTGVTIMKMDEGLDTGPLLVQEVTAITGEDDAGSLHDRLAGLGARLLRQTLPGYLDGRIPPRAQPPEGATYARRLTPADGNLNWHEPARALWNRIRALRPWPGAFTTHPHAGRPTRLKIWRAEPMETPGGAPGEVLQAGSAGIVVACGEQGLRILELQREGGKRVAAGPFLAGQPIRPGEKWG